MDYRRFHVPGATVFLTLVTHRRQPVLAHPSARTALRDAMKHVAARHPFKLAAFVVLPDHCHLLWHLPEDDGDFSRRVRLIKHHMARQAGLSNPLWQARFWDHLIRDETDFIRHLDYIHYNPVKHGHVERAWDWPDSSFRHFVTRGRYEPDWGVSGTLDVAGE